MEESIVRNGYRIIELPLCCSSSSHLEHGIYWNAWLDTNRSFPNPGRWDTSADIDDLALRYPNNINGEMHIFHPELMATRAVEKKKHPAAFDEQPAAA